MQDAVLGAAGVRGKAGLLRPAVYRSKHCWAVLLTSFPVKKETKLWPHSAVRAEAAVPVFRRGKFVADRDCTVVFGEKGRGMAEKAALRGCRRLGMRQRQKTVQDITAATYVGILFTVFLV